MFIALLLAAGLAALLVGAQLLVTGAARLALSLGLSPLVVGLTIVAFGTSAPELAVSVRGAWTGQMDVALGNVIGSNIFNVLFILGASALIVPLLVARQAVRQEVPIMIGASLLLLLLARDGSLGRGEGVLLLAILSAYLILVIWQSRRGETPAEPELPGGPGNSPTWLDRQSAQWLLVASGLALLVVGSNWLVDGAVGVARLLGLSELIIGLTIVAAGTSLPEVATSLLAAVRGQRDLAVGNVIGSNIFNIFAVLGVAAVVAPASLPVSQAAISFDLPVMIAVAIACLPIFFTGHTISRWEGLVFLGYYAAYTAFLLLEAASHDLLATYEFVMITVVIPLTLLTLLVVVAREFRHRTP